MIEQNSEDRKLKEQWIEAIYSYQAKKHQTNPNINRVGYLISGGLTSKVLLEDVRNNEGIPTVQ